ncbi:Sec-independent protein translocase TatB, partial [Mycobacterium tuberculosis]
PKKPDAAGSAGPDATEQIGAGPIPFDSDAT